jgi:hypothetical protein
MTMERCVSVKCTIVYYIFSNQTELYIQIHIILSRVIVMSYSLIQVELNNIFKNKAALALK